MAPNRQNTESILEPEIPDEENVWRRNMNDRNLTGISYRENGTSYVHLRSEGLKDMVGYSMDDIVRTLDEDYNINYTDFDIESVEYGNGWALIEFG